jgi:hypothetical protein
MPDRSTIRKYSQSPAIPSNPIKSRNNVSLPEKITKRAITHIAIALINRRENRLID